LPIGEIRKLYKTEWSERISYGTIKRILRDLGYKKRRPNKCISTGKSPHRAAQFRLVFYFAFLFSEMENNPILSIDTKKKERLGDGGFYDMKRNEGYMSIGTNNETAEFLADNLIWWWETYGIHHYPFATHLLVFCDCGGANSYRHHAFKKELQRTARYIGIRIVVVHYPPYCSKWNPIEHRLFSQIHRRAQGAIFTSYEQVKQIFESTTTKTGLKVFVRINHKAYQKGLKVKKDEIDQKRILKHPELPKFNYTILP